MKKIKIYKNKNFVISVIAFILLIFFPGFYQSYIDFHTSFDNRIEKLYEEDSSFQEDSLEEFSLDKISDIENASIFVGDKEYLDLLVDKINNATKKVYLETYIFTETRIQKALKKAYDRGLDVKVILEKNVYKAPNLNNNSFYNLKDYGININWATRNYALTHAKFFLIDNEVILSTGNTSYSAFSSNRDFFIEIQDEQITKVLNKIFENDFNGINKIPYKHELAISPVYSRIKMETLINSATSNINIYAQNFSDENIIDLLCEKSKSGVTINIVAPSITQLNSNEQAYIKLRESGVYIKEKTSPYIHAKALEIDNQYLFIGSVNYSDYSLDKNREVSLILTNKNLIEKFNEIFSQDLK